MIINSFSRITRSFILLSLTCVLLFVARFQLTGEPLGFGIIWNIFLAWIPLGFALIARRLQHHRKRAYFCMGLWLLFFPNAPYIITDLVHLEHLAPHLWWYDSLGLFLAAFTGLLLGIYSIQLVHGLLNSFFGQFYSWLALFGCMMLAGFGIYLGRFTRVNSWDVLANPVHLLKTCYYSLHNPLAIKTTILFGVVLSLLYVSYFIMFRPENELEKIIN